MLSADPSPSPVLYAGTVTNGLRSLWAEPRAPDPPSRVWRDWVLAAAAVIGTIVEVIVRSDVLWRPLIFVLGIGLVVPLLLRRAAPLLAVVLAFGAVAAADVAALAITGELITLYTLALSLVLAYSLFRWGSGREAMIGLAFILVIYVVNLVGDYTGIVDSVVGGLILLFPAELGAAIRYWSSARVRELDQVRLREREQLARELHDTVAHHVSAIAIQAQAGRTVAGSRPDEAVGALEVIEEEASRTLDEMRVMIGALRQGEEADLAPQRGVADIEQLALGSGRAPRVDVELSGDLDGLRPSVESALYRLAQESITNAVRHARRATRIDVRVDGEADCVRLTVSDDGEATSPSGSAPPGYGLVGMIERAALLGGTLEAGPAPGRGWTVSAILPRARVGT